MRNAQTRVSIETAKRCIAEFSERNIPSFAKHPEFAAAATHWLHNQNFCYPFFPLEIWRNRAHLTAYICASALRQATSMRDAESQLCLDFKDVPYPPPETAAFTFIDLFAGIGGFRIAMQQCYGKCVFSCEWNKYAQQTYSDNFGEVPFGDIRGITDAKAIPEHDILCAGFPCQPFSLAGVSKKNSLGRKHGFEDEIQGTLFFEIARILSAKRPKAFFLENVKNLLTHDGKKTFEKIRHILEDDLKYVVRWQVVDGGKWVPQHRERVFIVGFDPRKILIAKDDIVIPTDPDKGYERPELSDIIQAHVKAKYTLGPGTWATLERHKKHHAAAGHGFGYGLHELPISTGAVTRTMSARYHKDGAEILIKQRGPLPRRLTVDEAMQLQGFDPKRFKFHGSDTQAYRQIGNSVVVPAILATCREIVAVLGDRSRLVKAAP